MTAAWDFDDLRVSATAPPTLSVQVNVTANGSYQVAMPPPSARRAMHHAVVLRGGAVLVIADVQPEQVTMWVRETDLLLATVAMPASVGWVRQDQITDRRVWR